MHVPLDPITSAEDQQNYLEICLYLSWNSKSEQINQLRGKQTKSNEIIYNASQIDLFYAIRLKFPPDCCCVAPGRISSSSPPLFDW